MTPLRITARLVTAIVTPPHPIAIDSMLAWAVCQRDGIEPALTIEQLVPVEIPIQREPGGRFHLCSHSVFEAYGHETRYLNRRPVVAEAQLFGSPKLRTIDISSGLSKGYHVPVSTSLVEQIDWWCIGEADQIRDLLALVSYIGRRRAVGYGRVAQWEVEPVEPCGDGFPCVRRDGAPLRPLPPDWPGLVEPKLRDSVLSYPYDVRRWGGRAELCAVP